MNKFIGMGRLTREPDVKVTANAKIARYTLAIDRPQRREDGTREADFISCVAFNKSADFAEMYLHKGTRVLIEGRIQTGSYDRSDGTRVYTTDVVVDRHEFTESRSNGEPQEQAPAHAPVQPPRQTTMDDFMPIPDDVMDEGLPFN